MELRSEANKIGLKLGWRSKRRGQERRRQSEEEKERRGRTNMRIWFL